MRYATKVTVYLHSDPIVGCDCGERAWEVELPAGWHWATSAGPGGFADLYSAATYAHSLYPGHPDITPSLQPDQWDFRAAVPARLAA